MDMPPTAATQSKECLLFKPLTLRGITLPNRVMISPMCMYAAVDGKVNDFHLVQLGRYALGGAGLVMAEAAAVEARGRISPHDAGMWSDDQIEPWRRVTDFLRRYGSVPAIQLAHAGRKASTTRPWEGGGPVGNTEAGEPLGWTPVAPTSAPAGEGWQTPAQMSLDDIAGLVAAWGDAAARACKAGFDVVEVHGAHGYLIHTFLSPISNTRSDAYGGDTSGRIRLALEIASAVRAALPDHIGFFWRVSALDGIEGGWTMEDTVMLCRELGKRGVDVIDTSSGGISMDPGTYQRIRRGYGFHTPYAARIRKETGICTATVGLIVDPVQAEGILQREEADIIAIGRQALVDPHWTLNARATLLNDGFDTWVDQAGWWLDKRAPSLERLREAGDDPRVPQYETPAV